LKNRKAPPPFDPDYELIGYLEEPERVPLPPPIQGATYYPAQHHTDNLWLLEIISWLICFGFGVLVGRALF
jgi:hypothetical protein